jgi:hypothetical protein
MFKGREADIDRALKTVRGDLKRLLNRVDTMRTYLAILNGEEREMGYKFYCSWCGDGNYQDVALFVDLKPVCKFCVAHYTEVALGVKDNV